MIEDEDELCQLLQNNETMYFVSDCGTTNGHGYFGWVIVTAFLIVVENNGHAPGYTQLIESLRAESIAELSLLCFLLHISIFHKLWLNTDLWMPFCDNKTAVSRIKWYNVHPVLNPNLTLNADFDVQLQIEDTLHQLQIQ